MCIYIHTLLLQLNPDLLLKSLKSLGALLVKPQCLWVKIPKSLKPMFFFAFS